MSTFTSTFRSSFYCAYCDVWYKFHLYKFWSTICCYYLYQSLRQHLLKFTPNPLLFPLLFIPTSFITLSLPFHFIQLNQIHYILMPSKFFSFLFIFFLLLLLHRPLAYAARPTPAAPTTIPTQVIKLILISSIRFR